MQALSPVSFRVPAISAAPAGASDRSSIPAPPDPAERISLRFGARLNPNQIKLISGRSNPALAAGVAEYLGLPLTPVEFKDFSNGETYINIQQSVRNQDVFILQSTGTPVNHNLMELLLLIDAAKRNNAKTVTAVVPHYGYTRQDRRMPDTREPIFAKLVAVLLKAAGADRVVSVDMHSKQLEGFFDLPVDHLSALSVTSEYINSRNLRDAIVVSPDVGGSVRARQFAEKVNLPFAIVDKRRSGHNKAEALNIIGDVQDISGKTVIVVDDMIDTAGTIAASAGLLKKKGAKAIIVLATHPVLSGPALKNIRESAIDEVIVTDTIPLSEEAKSLGKIKQLGMGAVLGDAIHKIVGDADPAQPAAAPPPYVVVHPKTWFDRLLGAIKRFLDWINGFFTRRAKA